MMFYPIAFSSTVDLVIKLTIFFGTIITLIFIFRYMKQRNQYLMEIRDELRNIKYVSGKENRDSEK